MNNLMILERPLMTLKEITDLLEVRHDNAMRTVSKMCENQDFGNAPQIEERTTQGNNYLTYQLDKRQSIAVAAKLNTSLLMRVIDKWQELENMQPKLSPMEMVIQSAQATIDLQNKQKEQEKQLLTMQEGIDKLLAHQSINSGYYTVAGWASLNKISMPKELARVIEIKASKFCKENTIPIGKTSNESYGQVNTYPSEVIKRVYNDLEE